jgi:hypothetical protein
MKKHRSGVAVPCNADFGAVRFHLGDDVAAILLDQRIGLVSGEGAVDAETELLDPAGERLEQLRRDEARHAAAGIEDHAKWLDDRRIDEAEHVLGVAVEDPRSV